MSQLSWEKCEQEYRARLTCRSNVKVHWQTLLGVKNLRDDSTMNLEETTWPWNPAHEEAKPSKNIENEEVGW